MRWAVGLHLPAAGEEEEEVLPHGHPLLEGDGSQVLDAGRSSSDRRSGGRRVLPYSRSAAASQRILL